MSHYLEIGFILIILATNQSAVNGSTHAMVGNYSELNPKDCGITRFTPNLDNSCFKWHNNIVSGMKGRNVTEDEVPWIVHLVIRGGGECTGALIADNWVLTAAHCLTEDDLAKYYIHTGIYTFPGPTKPYDPIKLYRANRIIKHPSYKVVTSNSKAQYAIDDIGLIKLDRSIKSIKPDKDSQQSNRFKSICLPQKNIFNAKQEFALFGGWGMVDRYQWPLQVGIRLVLPSDDYSSVYSATLITALKMDNITLLCKGDSGGPLWQYYNGRAVIIGVLTMAVRKNGTNCEIDTFEELFSFFVRISKYIDWIENVIQII